MNRRGGEGKRGTSEESREQDRRGMWRRGTRRGGVGGMNLFFRILYFVILAAAVVFAVARDDMSFWGRFFTVLFPLAAVVINEIQLWRDRRREAEVRTHQQPGLANELHHAYREDR